METTGDDYSAFTFTGGHHEDWNKPGTSEHTDTQAQAEANQEGNAAAKNTHSNTTLDPKSDAQTDGSGMELRRSKGEKRTRGYTPEQDADDNMNNEN